MKRIFPLLLALLFLAGVAAAEPAPVFSEGSPHISTPAFAQYFKTMTAPLPFGTLSIAQRIYEPDQAPALLEAVRCDLKTIEESTGLPLTEHTVYIVERLVNGSIERQGNCVYVRPQDVFSGAYRPLLVCAALGTEKYWSGVGLTGCIWGCPADEAALAEYYARGDLAPLSLAVPFFLPDFATPEELTLARDTAVALCRYGLEQHGGDALLTGDGVALRRQWLQSIGVGRDFSDPCQASLQQYRFRACANYTLAAEDPHGNTFFITPMADVTTADDLRWFLHDLQAGPEALFALVEADAPEYVALLRSRYGKLRVYCGQDGSWAVPEYREIRLALGSGFMHELVHILLPPSAGASFYSTMWQYEGLCYWAGYQAYPMHAQKAQTHQALHFFHAMEDPQTPNHRFSKLAAALCMQGTLPPEHPADADVARYAHAMALVPLRDPDAAQDSAWAATIHDSYPATQNLNGNELTEYQSFSFTAHLIDQHGLATFLLFCEENLPFEQAFGVPYEAAREDWLVALNTTFD